MRIARVFEYPQCDVCKVFHKRKREARYDARLDFGIAWAYLCEECFTAHGTGLGEGKGQELVLISAKAETKCE